MPVEGIASPITILLRVHVGWRRCKEGDHRFAGIEGKRRAERGERRINIIRASLTLRLS